MKNRLNFVFDQTIQGIRSILCNMYVDCGNKSS